MKIDLAMIPTWMRSNDTQDDNPPTAQNIFATKQTRRRMEIIQQGFYTKRVEIRGEARTPKTAGRYATNQSRLQIFVLSCSVIINFAVLFLNLLLFLLLLLLLTCKGCYSKVLDNCVAITEGYERSQSWWSFTH